MKGTSRRSDALETLLAGHGRLVEDALDRYLPSPHTPPDAVHHAMRQSVFAGGTRLRSVLVIAAAGVAGAAPDDVMSAACAVEPIDAYSLIHDGLLAMDNSPTRRGRPTRHVAYGEHLGFAFQIVDDILDVVGEEAKLGKETGSDATLAKVTFPSVFGVARSRRIAEDAARQAVDALAPLGSAAPELPALAEFLLRRER